MQKNLKFKPSIKDLAVDALKIEREYSLDWWSHSSIFRYNALMVSSFYGMKWGNFRQFYNIPKNDFLFVADSGGYQVSTQKVAIEPTEVLNWMEANVDVGMTLDVPPLDMSLKVVGNFENFKLAARHSKRNYEIMHKNWNGKPELLKVIQGGTADRLDYWYNFTKELEFSGLAFSPKPVNEETVAITLAYANHVGAKKVHVFLGTSENISPITIYAKKFFDRLTFDSSTCSSSATRFRNYFLPYNLSKSITFGGQYRDKLKHLPCSCPVCKLATIDDFRIEKGSHATKTASLAGSLIALHNIYVYLQYYDFLTALSDDEEAYRTFLQSRGLNNTVNMLDFLDLAEQVGFYDAYNKFLRTGSMTSVRTLH
ncbi:MAG: hypothetical protein D4S01_01695 [Dehalococcoidia bacterium]|nr:MAG: hypothetical protein D4S01_01695 [Dehalococcoidia bacterium]